MLVKTTISTLILAFLVVSGCASMGSRIVPRDRFNYNESIAKSRNEQMLLNIVRLRYFDLPDFLAVSSIITSYSYEGRLGLSGTRLVDPNGGIYVGSANLGYTAKPTITYAPLAGQEFNRRLLKPIPIEVIFGLGHVGWPLDVLAAISLDRINELENMGFSQVPAPAGRPAALC